MTHEALINKRSTTKSQYGIIICIFCAGVMIIFGNSLKAAVYRGIIFSFSTIIPTLFPFFILSDIWQTEFRVNCNSLICKSFEKIFGINGSALPVLVIGLICGFPLGVKGASELYNDEIITDDEFERLVGFANNPSLAFVIFGVGSGVLGSTTLGILFYLSIVFSSIATAIIFRKKRISPQNFKENIRQSFNLVDSIKNAGINSINVASYIIFFSGVMGLLSNMHSEEFLTVISPFIEISNSVKMIAENNDLNSSLRLALISFALGFSGFSVHFQAFSFFPKNISKLKYLLMKLTQGFIASCFFFLFSLFI